LSSKKRNFYWLENLLPNPNATMQSPFSKFSPLFQIVQFSWERWPDFMLRIRAHLNFIFWSFTISTNWNWRDSRWVLLRQMKHVFRRVSASPVWSFILSKSNYVLYEERPDTKAVNMWLYFIKISQQHVTANVKLNYVQRIKSNKFIKKQD
jgi:hypothetical protein